MRIVSTKKHNKSIVKCMKVIYNIHIDKIVYDYSKMEVWQWTRTFKTTTLRLASVRDVKKRKKVNRFGLCKTCNSEVDREYAMLYGFKTMEY